jgi:hypothetical protein
MPCCYSAVRAGALAALTKRDEILSANCILQARIADHLINVASSSVGVVNTTAWRELPLHTTQSTHGCEVWSAMIATVTQRHLRVSSYVNSHAE